VGGYDFSGVFARNSEGLIAGAVIDDHDFVTGVERLEASPEPQSVVMRMQHRSDVSHEKDRTE
jgi:hypothetical protein